ncbi:hypothetical protein Dimus_022848, partial [Dionaea muscipula]
MGDEGNKDGFDWEAVIDEAAIEGESGSGEKFYDAEDKDQGGSGGFSRVAASSAAGGGVEGGGQTVRPSGSLALAAGDGLIFVQPLRQQQGGEGASAVWLDSGGSGGFSRVAASSAAGGGVEGGDRRYGLAGVGGGCLATALIFVQSVFAEVLLVCVMYGI